MPHSYSHNPLFNNIINITKNKDPVPTAVVNPVDNVSLGGAIESALAGLITPILCGAKIEIENTAKQCNFDISKYQIIDCSDEPTILKTSINLCRNGIAKILMKGKIHTDHLMRAVVQRDTGLRTTNQISHVFSLALPTYKKLLHITDAALNIAPSLEQKEKIIINAVSLLNKIGYTKPKVAVISATESIHPKMPSTADAHSLVNNDNLKNICIIEGPLAFDNIISKYAADIKGIKSEISGDVDIIVVPNIEAGNILFKALVYLAKAEVAGVVIGAKVPIILTSRADNSRARFLSSALACASL